MLLRTVVRTHASAKHALSNPAILGDSYLLNKNLVYRNVRQLTLDAGFTFVEAWPSYYTTLLFELPRILESKQIPFDPVAPLIEAISKKLPSNFPLSAVPSTGRNHHFHESCHCVAHAVLSKFRNESVNLRLLNIMLSESYANTCEAFTLAYAKEPIHSYFAQSNSSCLLDEDSDRITRELVELSGFHNAFLVTFYFHLYFNFLRNEIKAHTLRKLLKSIVPDVKLSAKYLKLCTQLFNKLREYDLTFQTRTNYAYLNYLGFQGPVKKTLSFDFMELLNENPAYGEAVKLLARVVEEGRWPSPASTTSKSTSAQNRRRSPARESLEISPSA